MPRNPKNQIDIREEKKIEEKKTKNKNLLTRSICGRLLWISLVYNMIYWQFLWVL